MVSYHLDLPLATAKLGDLSFRFTRSQGSNQTRSIPQFLGNSRLMDYMVCSPYGQMRSVSFFTIPFVLSLRPRTFADKRHEIAAAQVLYPVALPELGNLEQFLLPSRADRDYQSAIPG